MERVSVSECRESCQKLELAGLIMLNVSFIKRGSGFRVQVCNGRF